MEKYDSFTPEILNTFLVQSSKWHGARGNSAYSAINDIKRGSHGFAIVDGNWLRAVCSYTEYDQSDEAFFHDELLKINTPIIYVKNLAGAGHNAAWSIMKDLMQICNFEKKALVLQATGASYSFYKRLGLVCVDEDRFIFVHYPK